jgi:hypothetical protein
LICFKHGFAVFRIPIVLQRYGKNPHVWQPCRATWRSRPLARKGNRARVCLKTS